METSNCVDRGFEPADPGKPEAYDVLGPVGSRNVTRRRLAAAAARTRGLTTPYDAEIRELEQRLTSVEPPEPDTAAAKRRVVEASKNEAELRERIAALRGRLRTERELGESTEETAQELSEAAAKLSEVSTDRIAAEQALESAERDARQARDTRDRRLKLQDRIENRRREARAFLSDALNGAFEEALDRIEALVGGNGQPTADPGAAAGAGVQLAAVAIADLEAPIVIDARAADVEDPEQVARILEASVWLATP